MLRKAFALLGLFGAVSGAACQYVAPGDDIQQRLYSLHGAAGMRGADSDRLTETGKLYACFFIEEKLRLPQSEDSIRINENENDLQITGADDPRMAQIDKVISATLEDIKAASPEFSEAAGRCLEELSSQ